MQDYETQYIDYNTDTNCSMAIFIDIQFCSIKSIAFEKKNIKYPFIINNYLMFNTDTFQLRIYLDQLKNHPNCNILNLKINASLYAVVYIHSPSPPPLKPYC